MENINNKVTIKYLVNRAGSLEQMCKKFPGFIFTDIEEQRLRILKPRSHSVLAAQTHFKCDLTYQSECWGKDFT